MVVHFGIIFVFMNLEKISDRAFLAAHSLMS